MINLKLVCYFSRFYSRNAIITGGIFKIFRTLRIRLLGTLKKDLNNQLKPYLDISVGSTILHDHLVYGELIFAVKWFVFFSKGKMFLHYRRYYLICCVKLCYWSVMFCFCFFVFFWWGDIVAFLLFFFCSTIAIPMNRSGIFCFLNNFWPGGVAPDRILSMSQIELNCVLMLNWIIWNRTVLTLKLCIYVKLNCLKL